MKTSIRSRWGLVYWFFAFCLTMGLTVSSVAQEAGESIVAQRVLRVGTKQSPPFAIKNADGSWSGISIELWKNLTDELNLEYEFVELPLDKMLAQLEGGQLDAAVAAISVTAARHERVGFCHPHFSNGAGHRR